MERIEEVISLGVSEAESQGKEFMQIPTSSVKIILSLIDTQKKEIEQLKEYLIQIEDESSHEDGCLTQVNGMAQDALKQE